MHAADSPYNETVRRHFATAAHAGDLDAGYARVCKVEVSESNEGCRVILAAALSPDGARIEAMGYRIYGCPHLIAAAEAHCACFEGRPVAALHEFPLPELMAALDVPVEKTGRMLLLEDAVTALARQAEGGGWNESRSK
jgi:NifU-like protein involved in Fe-S cluster formation